MTLLLLACSDESVKLVPGAATEPLYVHDDSELFTWSAEGGLVEVGSFADADGVPPGVITDIAIGADGQLYAGSYDSLFLVDARDATVTSWGSLPDVATGLTVLPDGRLLVAGNALTAIDLATGTSETLAASGTYTTSGDVVAVPDGSVHWSVMGGAGDQWVRVDAEAGTAERVGDVGASSLWGVAWAGGELYAFSAAGEVYLVDPATGVGALVVTEAISFYGATTNPVVW